MTIGGELSVSSSSTVEIEYSCELVESREFNPSEDYIKKATEDPGVNDYLKIGGLGPKAFMVTGTNIAQGATITKTEGGEKEMTAQLGLELPSVPITIGPKGSHKTSNSRQTTETIRGPFDFAFQVEKLRVGLRGRFFHKEYVKGAMLVHGNAEENKCVVECVGKGLADEEAEDFDVQLRSGIVHGTGEPCSIVVA
ncbi:hypothetical protein CC86DRAFT_387281 [Ophiobolus disseminans]|uniref:Uncharacterized protein n=1 Tax=Ophiobolus disseminans TaxID=1469910 RepID=A0A6A6ZIU7_9PLEO|nr:hypothetical protein CC86DRAFT_387281 [Ophiobolus disseminans]